MVFVPLASFQSPPSVGSKFRLVTGMAVTKEGVLKPGKEGSVEPVTLQSVNTKTGEIVFSYDASPDATLSTRWKQGVYYVEAQSGGRRRRTRRSTKTRRTRRSKNGRPRN